MQFSWLGNQAPGIYVPLCMGTIFIAEIVYTVHVGIFLICKC